MRWQKLLFIFYSLTIVTACSSDITLTPQILETITQEATPTLRSTPAIVQPTEFVQQFSLDVEAGLIKSPEGNVIQLYNINNEFGSIDTNKKSPYWKMYASHKWTEKGLEITSKNGDVITITKSEVTDHYLKFSILKNGHLVSTVYTQDGALILFVTHGEGDDYLARLLGGTDWCLYSPNGNQCVACYDRTLNKSITCNNPYVSIILEFDLEWNLTVETVQSVDNKGFYMPRSCSYKNDKNNYVYALPNAPVYGFGGPSLPCPQFIITYP